VFIRGFILFPPLTMSTAHVTSTEAIEGFRAALLVYLSKAKPVLEDACDEVTRTRQWLQQAQRIHWENEVRKRTRALENAQQALFSQSIGSLRDPGMAEKMAVTRAKRLLAEAEEKLQAVKRWNREFDHLAAPMVKQLESLRTVMAAVMPKAVAHLGQTVRVLDAYANVAPGGVSGAATASEVKTEEAPATEKPAEGTP
jgi:hypothetical protein